MPANGMRLLRFRSVFKRVVNAQFGLDEFVNKKLIRISELSDPF